MNDNVSTYVFEKWMNRIMERFDDMENLLAISEKKNKDNPNSIEGDRLLDNQDLCFLLKASKRSLQRYRSEGLLPYQKMGHSIFYKESDVKVFLKTHFEKMNQKKE